MTDVRLRGCDQGLAATPPPFRHPTNLACSTGIRRSMTIVWHVEAVVLKNVQAAEIEPISFEIRFLVEPGSEDERQVQAWRPWGIPFRDMIAEAQSGVGP